MNPVLSLIERRLPGCTGYFELAAVDSENGLDTYEIEKAGNRIILRGSSIISQCAALGYFLKHILCVDISFGQPITDADVLAPDFAPYRAVIPQKYRSYMNFCTHSYSCAWWDFERWEQEIDLMALCGINLPLSVTGNEAVWYYTLLELGFTDAEARDYLVGPAYQAWQLMGNIESFAGPLPKSWIESHIELGKRIIERETELGMMPIQQGFTGCVPISFIERFPESRILIKKPWNNISKTAQLDPTDSLFIRVGDIYMDNLKRLFGLHGFYAADPFHEGTPPVEGDEYLTEVGNIIKVLMHRHDEAYRWVMQSWSIRMPIAKTLEREHLLILDLSGSRHKSTNGFAGYEFVTGSLHNFGARMNLHGDIARLAGNTYASVKAHSDNVCGTGLFMEGIGQNPLYYDLAFDMLTSDTAADIDGFVQGYCLRRYKNDSEEVISAVRSLIDTVYTENSDNVLKCASLLCARPSLSAKGSGPCDSFDESYDNSRLFKTAEMYSKLPIDTPGFRYDKCDILRQALSNLALKIYREITSAYKNKDRAAFSALTAEFRQLLLDIDNLTYQIPEWRMQKWIDNAKAFALNDSEAALYEYNARMQVTIWGNEENCVLFDYAWKEWSGLISGYYLERWSRFFDMLDEKLLSGEDYTEDGLEEFENRIVWGADGFRTGLAMWEAGWIRSSEPMRVWDEDTSVFDRLLEKYAER